MINSITITGRLVADPVRRQTSIDLATFTVACDRNYKNKDGQKETDFIPVQVWRQTATYCLNYLKKGSMVAIHGRLQVRHYEVNGEKKTAFEIVADNIQNLSPSQREVNKEKELEGFTEITDEKEGFDDIAEINLPF